MIYEDTYIPDELAIHEEAKLVLSKVLEELLDRYSKGQLQDINDKVKKEDIIKRIKMMLKLANRSLKRNLVASKFLDSIRATKNLEAQQKLTSLIKNAEDSILLQTMGRIKGSGDKQNLYYLDESVPKVDYNLIYEVIKSEFENRGKTGKEGNEISEK